MRGQIFNRIGKQFLVCLAIAAAGAAMLAMAPATHADTLAFDTGALANPAASNPGNVGLVGFEFTLNENITITQLGFYAQSIGGGDTPHIAILDITGGATNPPTVLYDTGDINADLTVDPGFNYISVSSPLILTTGKTYELSAPAYFAQSFTAGTTAADFSYGSAIASYSFESGQSFFGGAGWDSTNSGYDYTDQTSTNSAPLVSADFEYTPATAVPEPASMGLLMVSAGALLMRRRRPSQA